MGLLNAVNFITIFLGLTFAAQAGPDVRPESTPPPLQFGITQTLTPADKADVHYKLRLPGTYTNSPTTLFPVLINHNPSGKTNLKPYEEWAEKNGVILLGIDGISNGKPQMIKDKIADAVLKDLVTRGVRAHPTRRFVIGMSGGSADGMRLVRRKPESYAGLVFMGAGQIIERPDAKHLAYAILGGAKDEWMPGDACYALAAKARALGCRAHVEVEIDRQHKEAPLDRQLTALNWLLDPTSKVEQERPAKLSPVEQRYRDAEDLEIHAGIKPDALGEVLPVWEALAKDVAGTALEAKVARRIRIVKLFIDTPSTIQHPTKLKPDINK